MENQTTKTAKMTLFDELMAVLDKKGHFSSRDVSIAIEKLQKAKKSAQNGKPRRKSGRQNWRPPKSAWKRSGRKKNTSGK